jgi:hypothetical protein
MAQQAHKAILAYKAILVQESKVRLVFRAMLAILESREILVLAYKVIREQTVQPEPKAIQARKVIQAFRAIQARRVTRATLVSKVIQALVTRE